MKDKKNKYLKFVSRFRHVDIQADFFGVSVATVRKWQILDSKIPTYVYKIIDKHLSIEQLEKDLQKSEFETTTLKLEIQCFFDVQESLKKMVLN